METEREMYKQIHDASYCGHYTGEEGAADTSVRRNSGNHRNGRSTTRLTMKTLAIVIYIVVLVTDSVIGLPVSDNLEADALKFLGRFGYISSAQAEQGAQSLMSVDLSEAIKKLQRMGGITQTGVLDIRTRELMQKPRCGVKDPVGEEEGGRKKRYVLAPSKWDHTDLTYRIENYTPDLPWQEVRRVIADAFKVWSDVTDLTFTEVMNTKADIMIKFASKYHKDGYPFDGKGLILAHAFFPGKDKGGDTHFDEDEKWTINSNGEGVDLFMVAAHEFGHALGLSHSNEPKALMYPWYQGYIPDFQLPYDDTLGIQVIYGGKGPYVTFRPPARTTRRPDTGGYSTLAPPRKAPIDPCKGNFDAIAVIRSEVFIFIGKYFWRSREPKTILSSEPSTIHDFWYGLPDNVESIDAAFEHPTNRRIYFFSGNRYWIYDGNSLSSGHPRSGKPITDFGIPQDIEKIDAVFVWGFNKRIYLISNDMYWKFKESDEYIEPDYPRDMSIWKNVPIPVDTAFKFQDNTYFLKGKEMYKFYDMKMRVALNWPKSIEDFLGCGDRFSVRKYDIKNSPEKIVKKNSASRRGGSILVLLCLICIGLSSI